MMRFVFSYFIKGDSRFGKQSKIVRLVSMSRVSEWRVIERTKCASMSCSRVLLRYRDFIIRRMGRTQKHLMPEPLSVGIKVCCPLAAYCLPLIGTGHLQAVENVERVVQHFREDSVQSKLYRTRPTSMHDLKGRIQQAFQEVTICAKRLLWPSKSDSNVILSMEEDILKFTDHICLLLFVFVIKCVP